MLSSITRLLYRAARLSNKARIVTAFLKGNPTPLLRHERNRLYFRLLVVF